MIDVVVQGNGMTAVEPRQETVRVFSHVRFVCVRYFAEKCAFFLRHCLDNELFIACEEHECAAATFTELFLCRSAKHLSVRCVCDSVSLANAAEDSGTVRPKLDVFL